MTEPTIEQLIDEVIEDAKIYGINMNAGGNLYSSLDTSRAALLSRTTQIQQEAEEHKSFLKMVMNHVDKDEDDGKDCNRCFVPRSACSICSSEKDKLNIHKAYRALVKKWSEK